MRIQVPTPYNAYSHAFDRVANALVQAAMIKKQDRLMEKQKNFDMFKHLAKQMASPQFKYLSDDSKKRLYGMAKTSWDAYSEGRNPMPLEMPQNIPNIMGNLVKLESSGAPPQVVAREAGNYIKGLGENVYLDKDTMGVYNRIQKSGFEARKRQESTQALINAARAAAPMPLDPRMEKLRNTDPYATGGPLTPPSPREVAVGEYIKGRGTTEGMESFFKQFEPPKPPADYTLGSTRFSGATNKPIATVEDKSVEKTGTWTSAGTTKDGVPILRNNKTGNLKVADTSGVGAVYPALQNPSAQISKDLAQLSRVRQSMESVRTNLNDDTKREKFRDRVGVLAGTYGQLADRFVGVEPETARSYAELATAFTMVYALSGKQVSEKEIEKFKPFLPSATLPSSTLSVRLNVLIDYLNGLETNIKESSRSSGRPFRNLAPEDAIDSLPEKYSGKEKKKKDYSNLW